MKLRIMIVNLTRIIIKFNKNGEIRNKKELKIKDSQFVIYESIILKLYNNIVYLRQKITGKNIEIQ